MAYLGNTPGVSSQRVVLEEVISGSAKSVFTPVSGYNLGYVDVLVNGVEIDSNEFTASDGVTVTLGTAAQVGDTVKIKTWLPRGLSDGYLKSEADARYPLLTDSSAAANSVLYRNGSKAVTSSSGFLFDGTNMGFSITPSAWYSERRAIHLGRSGTISGSTGANFLGLTNNMYLDGSSVRKYITSGAACMFELQTDGSFRWQQATSGTADATLTPTTPMTLDASGNLGVGTASVLGNSTVNAVQGFAARNSGSTLGYFQTYNSNAGADLKTWRWGGDNSGNLIFQTVNDAYSSSATRMTLSNSGQLLVNTGASAKATVGIKANSNAEALALIGRASDDFVELHFRNSADTATLARLSTEGGNNLSFAVGGAERARFINSRLFIGNNGTLSGGSEYSVTLGGASNQLYMSATGSTTSYGGVSNPMIWGTNGLTIGCDNNNVIQFIRYVNSSSSVTENARFDGTGNLVMNGGTVWGSGGALCGSFSNFGSGSTNAKAIVWGQYSSSAGVPQVCGNWASGGSWGIGPHTSSNDSILRIGVIAGTSSGVYWQGNYVNIYAGAYTNASDYRIKENIVSVADGVLAKVLALRSVTYNLIHEPDEDGDMPPVKDEVGFLAHEIQQHFPVLVTGEKDAVDGEGNPQHQGVDYAKLSAYLVKAIQEQQALIVQLQADVETLKGQV